MTWGLEGNRPDSRTGAKKEVGIRDWLIAGLMRSVGFYVFSGGVMAALACEWTQTVTVTGDAADD